MTHGSLALDFGLDKAKAALQREHPAAPESGADPADEARAPVFSGADRLDKTPFTWSEAHRHACEVRYCLSRGRAWTIEYRIGVERHRGREAGDRLWRDVVKAAREARMNKGNDDAA